mgnify:CR=1 FL=1
MTNSQLVARVSSRVWGRHAPTRPRLRSNERPSGAFEWQPGLAQARWRGFAPTRATSKRGRVAEVQSRRGTTFSRIENLRSRVAAPSSSSPLPPQAAVVAVAVPKRSFFFYPSTLRLYSSTSLACGSSYEQKPPRRPELPVPAGRLFAFMKRRKTLRGLRRWSG